MQQRVSGFAVEGMAHRGAVLHGGDCEHVPGAQHGRADGGAFSV